MNSNTGQMRAVNEGVPQELANYRPFVSLDGEGGVQEIDRNDGDGSDTTYPFEISLGLSQPLYRGGRTVASVRSAEFAVQAARATYLSIEQQVFLDAITAYMDVVREQAVLVTERPGGHGAAREVAERLLAARGQWSEAVTHAAGEASE